MKQALNANILLVLVSLMMPASNAAAAANSGIQADAETPRNVELTNAAWDAFKHHKYEDAIAAAERCVQRFKKEADQTQSALEQKKAKAQPTGKVSAEQKKAIFDQGVLNDVATCYWIKGRSAQLLKRNDEAKEAYNATIKYSYARSWDPRGWFWSPTEDAADRLQDLK
jgi:hypothetical protein